MKIPNLLVNTTGGYTPIVEHSISYVLAQGSYASIVMEDGEKYISTKNLKEVEEILNPSLFFRIHHSHLINLSLISEVKNGTNQKVVMRSGTTLEISKRRKSEFLALFRRL